jgi:hypothetical protein
MPRGAVAPGWGHTLLIALLVLLLPAAAGIDADECWQPIADPAYADQHGIEPAAGALADSVPGPPASPALSEAVPAAPSTPLVAVRACVAPPDRAPPRA